MAKSKAVSKRAGTAVIEYGEDAGSGFEDTTRDDFSIPFIGILQSNSPQTQEDDGAYVKNAKPGMFYNNVTEEIFSGKEGIRFIPCHRTHSFVEWAPRDSGGGLVEVYDSTDPYVTAAREGKSRFGKLELENGNYLVETFSMFGLMLRGQDATLQWDQVVISFSSTGIKSYKQWMTRASAILVRADDGRNVRPPLFSHVWRLTTRPQENNKGKWHGWAVNFDNGSGEAARLGEGDLEVYEAARGFRQNAVEFSKDVIRKMAREPEEDSDAM